MKTQPPLLPCPFCGGAATLTEGCSGHWVECDNGHQGATSQDPALAMFSWERRPKPAEKVIFRGYAVECYPGCFATCPDKKTAKERGEMGWGDSGAPIRRVRVVEVKPKKKAKK